MTASKSDHSGVLLTFRTNTCGGNKGLSHIGNDKLKKVRRYITGRFGTENAQRSCLRNSRDESVPIDLCPFDRNEEIARSYLTTVMLS